MIDLAGEGVRRILTALPRFAVGVAELAALGRVDPMQAYPLGPVYTLEVLRPSVTAPPSRCIRYGLMRLSHNWGSQCNRE